MPHLVYTVPLITAALAAVVLIMLVARRRAAPGAPVLMIMLGAAAIWTGAYALEIATPDLDQKLFWSQVEYLGIVVIVPAWFVSSIQLVRQDRWLCKNWRGQLLLAFIPAVTLLLVWTNPLHGLVWSDQSLDAFAPIPMLALEHGAWFWIFLIYNYVLLLVGALWILRLALGASGLARRQAVVMLSGLLPVWIANLLYVLGWYPEFALDLTPFALIVAGAAYAFSLIHYHLLDPVPVALPEIFAVMADAVIVTDTRGRIIKVNPAAARLAPPPDQPFAGRPVAALWADLPQLPAGAGGLETELVLAQGGAEQIFEVRVTALQDCRRQAVGVLYVLHDITQRRRSERDLQQLTQTLESRVAERTSALRASEARYHNLFEEAPIMYVITQPQESGPTVVDCNELFLETLGYRRADVLGQPLSRFYTAESCTRMHLAIDQGVFAEMFGREERQLVTSGGELVDTLLRTRVQCDAAGRVIGTRVMFVDISARKRAERRLKQTTAELRALGRHLEHVREEERAQIARQIHDELGQMLTALALDVGWLSRRLANGDETLNRKLEAMGAQVGATIKTVQRISAELRPGLLDHLGLVAALDWLVREFEQRTGMPCTFSHDDEALLNRLVGGDLATTLFRIAQEALTNVARHAQAAAVSVRLLVQGGELRLEIADDGVGFDPAQLDDPASFGLIGMRERLYPWQGRLTIESAPGSGATVSAAVPLPQETEPHPE